MDPLIKVSAGVKRTSGQGPASGSPRAGASRFHAAGDFRVCSRALLAQLSLGGNRDCS